MESGGGWPPMTTDESAQTDVLLCDLGVFVQGIPPKEATQGHIANKSTPEFFKLGPCRVGLSPSGRETQRAGNLEVIHQLRENKTN